MAFIDSLIRKKKLARAREALEWEAALEARAASARECAVAGREHADISRYLWQLLETDEPLCVQRLAAASREENRCQERVALTNATHRSDCQRVAEADARLARLRKDLEKLEERRAEHQSQLHAQHETQEAQRLDEWVVSRYGRKGGR